MDMNFASFVHDTVDALCHLTVQTPEITVLRCARIGMSQPLLSIPDMDPLCAFFVIGIKSLGSLLDNWIDIIYVLVQGDGSRSLAAHPGSPQLLIQAPSEFVSSIIARL